MRRGERPVTERLVRWRRQLVWLKATPENKLTDTYWYVPHRYLPAYLSINGKKPRIATKVDQTVWHFDGFSHGYVYGISATNIGFGWSYMLLVGSVVPGGAVKLSFAPLGQSSGSDDSNDYNR